MNHFSRIILLLNFMVIPFLYGESNKNELMNSYNSPVSRTVQSNGNIADLVINDQGNSPDWSIETGLSDGDEIYGDRDYTITSMPDELSGCEWIKTANDSKKFDDSDILAVLTVSNDLDLYIVVDDRIENSLDWLIGNDSNWNSTGKEITDNQGVVFSLYMQSLHAGSTLELGKLDKSKCSMYFMVLKPYPGNNITYLEINDNTNRNDWSIESGISEGDEIYGDRDYTITSMPDELSGCGWIKTANDSKEYNDSGILAILTVSNDLDLYIAVDDRIGNSLEWLTGYRSSWSDTDKDITDNKGVKYSLYIQSLPIGSTLELGNLDEGNCSMYFMILKPVMTYQGENAYLYHANVEAEHSSYTGNGYVNYINEVGSYIEWNVSIGSSGDYDLAFRYANGSDSRSVDIIINGDVIENEVDFLETGEWDNWHEKTINVPLNRGNNTIRVIATGSSGGPNFDKMDITPVKQESSTLLMGWATQNMGTTGGEGGSTITVNNYNDLKNAVTGSESRIIRIVGTISGSGMLPVGSNKTIWGGEISGFGFDLDGVENVIIHNIEFYDWNDDAINLTNFTTNVWIDHCSFSNGFDGCVDIKRGSSYVTVSWNHFMSHVKTCLLGASDGHESQDKGNLKVTYHHNWFDGTSSRHPRVRFGHVHVFNNYFTNNGYGVASTMSGEVLVEGNYFYKVDEPTLVGYAASGSGDLAEKNNIYDQCGDNPETRGSVPLFPYPYTLDDTESIPSIVSSYAGPRDELAISDGLKWSERMALSIMKRNPKAFQIDDNKEPKWDYVHGLVLTSFEKLFKETNNKKYYDYIEEYADVLIDSSGLIETYILSTYNLDMINAGRTLFELYNTTKKEKYFKAMQLLRKQLEDHPRTSEGGFWHKKIYPNQMWLDGLYMAEPFYTRYSYEFENESNLNDVAKQFELIQEHSLDIETGLLYHGWDESRQMNWANGETGTSSSFWSRSLGWYAMALVDVLDFFPEDHSKQGELVFYLNELAKALVEFQDESGLWYQVTDMGDREGNYLEASGSSMFAYVLAKGVNKGYLSSEFKIVANNAFDGLINQLIKVDADGEIHITQVCAIAGLGGSANRDGSFEYYINERKKDDDPKATGPFILAAIELNR